MQEIIRKIETNASHMLLFFAVAVLITVASDYTSGPIGTNSIARADTGQNASGWAWSDNIGWIAFNCLDNSGTISTNSSNNVNPSSTSPYNNCPPGGAANHGVSVDTNGYFSGYAWNDSIGWIRFDPVPDPAGTGCTSGDCRVHVDLSASGNTSVTGWARACSVFSNNSCGGTNSSPDNTLKSSNTLGGWDGWIEFSDPTWTNGTFLNKTVGSSKFGHLQGYAWGGETVGWVSLDPLLSGGVVIFLPPTITGNTANDSATSVQNPVLNYGDPLYLFWGYSDNSDTCSATGGQVGLDNWGSTAITFPGSSKQILPAPGVDTSYTIHCVKQGDATSNVQVKRFDISPVGRFADIADAGVDARTSINVNVTWFGSFSQPITLSIQSSSPALIFDNQTFTPSPTPFDPSKTRTVSFTGKVSNLAAQGNYVVTISGTDGSVTKTKTANLRIGSNSKRNIIPDYSNK